MIEMGNCCFKYCDMGLFKENTLFFLGESVYEYENQ